MTVKIYDDEGIQKSELIGCARVSLRDLEPGKVKDVWLNLVKDLEVQRDRKNRGQVSFPTFESCIFLRISNPTSYYAFTCWLRMPAHKNEFVKCLIALLKVN